MEDQVDLTQSTPEPAPSPAPTPAPVVNRCARNELKLGEAASSKNVEVAAVVLYDKCQAIKNEPRFSEITMDYIEDDNLQNVLSRHCVWLGKTSIPKNVDIKTWDPKAASEESREYLKASSKAQCASKLKEAFKDAFPQHPAWSTHHLDGGQGWWSTMRKQLEKAATRHQNKNETEEDTSIYPLYLMNTHGFTPIKLPPDDPANEQFNGEITSIDMEAVDKPQHDEIIQERKPVLPQS